jgi:hypothetical protein
VSRLRILLGHSGRARLEIIKLGHDHFVFASTFGHELTERANPVAALRFI